MPFHALFADEMQIPLSSISRKYSRRAILLFQYDCQGKTHLKKRRLIVAVIFFSRDLRRTIRL